MPKKEPTVTMDRRTSGELRNITGPAQIAIVAPVVTMNENEEVSLMPLSEDIRNAIEHHLLKHRLLYRGVAVKVMQEAIPQAMKDELLELRQIKKDILESRYVRENEGKVTLLGRVKKAWEAGWKA
jgi:hypothetical protein